MAFSYENLVIDALMYDIAKSIPPEDVGQSMLGKGLLLPQEYIRFVAMTSGHHQDDTTINKFLLECLKHRDPGYLNKFCDILTELKAENITEMIQKEYEGMS